MARFTVALTLLLASSSQQQRTTTAFPTTTTTTRTTSSSSLSHQHSTLLKQRRHSLQPRHGAVSVASSTEEFDNQYNNDNIDVGEAIHSVTNAVGDSIANVVREEPDLDQADIERRQNQIMMEKRVKVYKVTLPLVSSSSFIAPPPPPSSSSSPVLTMGMSVQQVDAGRQFSAMELDLDTLQYINVVDTTTVSQEQKEPNESSPSILNQAEIEPYLDYKFHGLIVSKVTEGSAAWVAGVRAGHVLRTSSATMGQQLWPKSTLEGVRSAISSRKAVSKNIQFELQRINNASEAAAVDNQYELTLTRPIGLQLKETEDGYVEVGGFTENAPNLVQYACRIGDRVLAVDSNMGDKLWPVSTVEGVISAVTSRLPGQQITMRFERQDNINPVLGEEEAVMQIQQSVTTTTTKTAAAASASAKTATTSTTVQQPELLKRCRDVIRRYRPGDTLAEKGNFVNKYAIPGLVADKVVDSCASAGIALDAKTLFMVMRAYTSCEQPQQAINVFEAATGLGADGSTTTTSSLHTIVGKDDNRIQPNSATMNLFSVSALMQAHAKKGDLSSVRRVLAAVSGRGNSIVDGLEVAAWPGTGENGVVVPDTRCYNIAISAAADSRAENGLDLALLIFDGMSEPNQKVKGKVPKDLVAYNTVIKALEQSGRFDEALDLFSHMLNKGLRPDIYSYMAIATAVSANSNTNDITEMLYDMKDHGVTPDITMFNTIIRTFCERKNIGGAKKVLGMMHGEGVSPNSITYGTLMRGLLASKKPSAALTLFESAASDPTTVSMTQNVHLYTTAISAAAAIGDDERAVELVSRMTASGVKPNLKTMTALMGAYVGSSKPEMAVEIYKRIPKPDQFATSQGLRAMCEANMVPEAFAIVSKLERRQRMLTPKDLLSTYRSLLGSSLESNDFDLAREVVSDMLRKGKIPSKELLRFCFDSMSLFPKLRRGVPLQKFSDEMAEEKFKFLLSLLDSLNGVNLPCEGPMYATILAYGSRMGGRAKKLSSLLVWAKTLGTHEKIKNTIIDETRRETIDEALTSSISSWENLFDDYDDLKDELYAPSVLPKLRVRVSPNEVSSVLRAEKYLSYRPRRRQVV